MPITWSDIVWVLAWWLYLAWGFGICFGSWVRRR